MKNYDLTARLRAAWHEDGLKGRLRRALVVLGLLLALAIALWPVSRSAIVYKTISVPAYYGDGQMDRRVPSGEHRAVSCGSPLLSLTKNSDDNKCSDKTNGHLLMAGIVGGVFIAGAIWLVPLFAPGRREDAPGQFQA